MSALNLLYSKLMNEILSSPMKKATPEQWSNYLRNRGVKKEELENFEQKAIKDANYPADRQITPEEAAAQFRVLGDVPIRETKLSRDRKYLSDMFDDAPAHHSKEQSDKRFSPKYGSEYSLAGAPEDAYEELVLHSPWADKLSPDPSHYTDIPGGDQNIGWLRYNTRDLQDQSQKLFHLDELQSNRHQTGQKFGYESEFKDDIDKAKYLLSRKDAIRRKLDDLPWEPDKPKSDLRKSLEKEFDALADEYKQMTQESSFFKSSPDAPFKGEGWKNLGVRRALIEAAQKDADLFSWTPSSLQKQRWGMEAEGLQRFYDKDLPNILHKELKAHGVTPEDFIQIDDPSKIYDPRDLHPSLAALIANRDHPDLMNMAELVSQFEQNPSMIRKQFYEAGMAPDKIDDAIEELSSFHKHYNSLDDAGDLGGQMESMSDFMSDFVPNYLGEGLGLHYRKIPAVKLTPEVRESILFKGFPKYILPLGAAGLGSAVAEPSPANAMDRLSDDILSSVSEQATSGLEDISSLFNNEVSQSSSPAEAFLSGAYAPFRPIIGAASMIGIPEMALLETLANNVYERPLALPTKEEYSNWGD